MKSLSEAIREEDTRRAGAAEMVVTRSQLIEIVDSLGTAKTRCAALAMCSEALDAEHRDAVDFLARDTDHIIDLAIDMIEALRNGEGNANG